LEDGCYIHNGELIGCMKATVFECDREWFFQLTTPLNEHGANYISAEGIVPIDQEYHDCFEMESGCDFCLTFHDATYAYGLLTVESEVSSRCGGQSTVDHKTDDFTARGAECGVPGYFAAPCPSRADRDYYSPISASTVDEIMSTTDEFESLFLEENGCLFIRNNRNGEYGVMFCPSVLMDSCGGAAIFTSSAGILFNEGLIDGESMKQCAEFSSGTKFCVQPQMDTDYSSFVSGEVRITIENRSNSEVFYDYDLEVYFEYPPCGESHLSCFADDFDSLPSPIDFTSDWLSALLSLLLSSGSSQEFSVSSWFQASSSDFSAFSPIADSPSSADSVRHHRSPSSRSSRGSSSSHSSHTNTTAIVLGTLTSVFALVAMIVAVALVILRRRSRKSEGGDLYDLMVQNE